MKEKRKQNSVLVHHVPSPSRSPIGLTGLPNSSKGTEDSLEVSLIVDACVEPGHAEIGNDRLLLSRGDGPSIESRHQEEVGTHKLC